jgi:5-methylcytosine-specific restriction endonuclease McrA
MTKLTKEEYIAHLEFETGHRKRWITKAVPTRRYVKGMINNKIKDRIHSRFTGQTTMNPKIRRACLAKTGGRCYLCLRRYTTDEKLADMLPRLYFTHLQIDHVVPFSKFGPNSLSNYMPCCSSCNNAKSDLSLAEFRAGVRKGWRKF